ncbi:MAG: hypothetical protein RL754_356 [Bacteroidota bacterium]|jgi:hypothetical protein
MKNLLGVVLVLVSIGMRAQKRGDVSIELGYMRAIHDDQGVNLRDWIRVDGTWSDPTQYVGQSTYAFTFRDTTYYYGFNHDLPVLTTRVILSGSEEKGLEINLLQSLMLNSWHQLSFMLGSEFVYRPVDAVAMRVQAGLISGYHMVNRLEDPTLGPLEGRNGNTLLGANATLDWELGRGFKARLSYNPLVTALGVFYEFSL